MWNPESVSPSNSESGSGCVTAACSREISSGSSPRSSAASTSGSSGGSARTPRDGPITVNALTGGDIDVALLFTGSSVIPKDAVLLFDDNCLQPADNPVFLMRKSVATPAALKIVNAVSAKLTTAAYNKMSFDISENKQDPSDVATAFLKKNKLG